MAARRHRGGRPFTRAKAQMFATYGTHCHICGHDGGLEADHLIPLSEWPDQPIDPDAMRPAHGSNYPCPVCQRECNQERGTKPLDQLFRPKHNWD